MSLAIDPITFEVIQNALASVADEMALVIMRTAYSPVVRDTMDYSTALCDREGRVVAQGLTLAVQLGAFPDIMRCVRRDFGTDLGAGDVLIANDPYGSGGQHLPDIYIIKPIFIGGRLEGFAATMAHHSDVGGLTPGSVAIHATEIHQEGLRLPLVKLYEGGRECTTVLRIIAANTRTPVQVLGDLRAQLAACAVAERGLVQLVARYGAEALAGYFDALHDHAERIMRAEIAAVPDGVYRFTDYIDGVGETPTPLAIAVTVTVSGDSVGIDFTGSAGQIPAGINCPIAMVNSACYCAIRSIASRAIPNCEGYMRPVTVTAPAGTLVNPLFPAACGARGVIAYRVFDAIMGALAQVIPEKVMAAGEGGPSLFSIGGTERGRPFVLTEVMVGSWGARAGRDGLEGVSNPAANLSNQPVELIEAELPLKIARYGLVPDTGGPGRFRGGLAFDREFHILAAEALFTVRADRRDHPPYGLAGGGSGSPSVNHLIRGGVDRALPTMPMEGFILRKGDVFLHHAAGGGGFGDPFRREPGRVLEDVLDEKVTLAHAAAAYGVVIDPVSLTVDEAATRRRRAGTAAAAD
ncbi:MAG: hydantoinase B/oxoprolinase family protein [Alphaproteobacteria bacterium]|nr:hydantoinase B/oxoprolinase family protein [Alphaproteobacteria bacterium]